MADTPEMQGPGKWLLEWLRERRDNARRLADAHHPEDRAGWLEDAAYFDAAASAVESLRHPAVARDTPTSAARPMQGLADYLLNMAEGSRTEGGKAILQRWASEVEAVQAQPASAPMGEPSEYTDTQRFDFMEKMRQSDREHGFKWNAWTYRADQTIRAQLDASMSADAIAAHGISGESSGAARNAGVDQPDGEKR